MDRIKYKKEYLKQVRKDPKLKLAFLVAMDSWLEYFQAKKVSLWLCRCAGYSIPKFKEFVENEDLVYLGFKKPTDKLAWYDNTNYTSRKKVIAELILKTKILLKKR